MLIYRTNSQKRQLTKAEEVDVGMTTRCRSDKQAAAPRDQEKAACNPAPQLKSAITASLLVGCLARMTLSRMRRALVDSILAYASDIVPFHPSSFMLPPHTNNSIHMLVMWKGKQSKVDSVSFVISGH